MTSAVPTIIEHADRGEPRCFNALCVSTLHILMYRSMFGFNALPTVLKASHLGDAPVHARNLVPLCVTKLPGWETMSCSLKDTWHALATRSAQIAGA